MKQTGARTAMIIFSGVVLAALQAGPACAQSTAPKKKKDSKATGVRSVTFANMTLKQAEEKARELLKPDDPQDKFFVKSIDVKVDRRGLRYKVTFQNFLPRTRYAFAASRLALKEAVDAAKLHGGTLVTDLKAFRYKQRVYYAYVTRVIAPRESRLNFRVIPDLPENIFKETIGIQQKFGRRLVESSKYTDRNDRTLYALLFVDRALKVNRPNFRNR